MIPPSRQQPNFIPVFRSFQSFFVVLWFWDCGNFTVGFIYSIRYKITILDGMIPPLIMIIGIPNTIFFNQ
jgi:hypothetical protein